MAKYAIFAFNGNRMCFTHALINALDLAQKGHEARVIIEGEAVKLVRTLTEAGDELFQKARDAGLIDGACRACSHQMGVLAYNEASGIALLGDMLGHPSFSGYIERGYQIITM
jgi:hypothetical protein